MRKNYKESIYAYRLIEAIYKGKTTERSGVPLINHIDEGIILLLDMGYDLTDDAIKAYCLHPIIQTDEYFLDDGIRESIAIYADKVTGMSLAFAFEYRNIANQYLSTRKISSISEINISPIKAVNDMLKADKIQNYKDFLLYHKDSHSRSKELDQYFHNWFKRLGVRNIQEEIDKIS